MSTATRRDEQFLEMALAEALQARQEGNAPIGAILATNDGKLLARSHNQTYTNTGTIYHAEMLLFLKHQELFLSSNQDMTLYTTLEPCLMCLGTALVHHVQRIVWLVDDHWSGGTRCYNVQSQYLLHRNSELVRQHIPALCTQAVHLLVDFYSRQWSIERIRIMLGQQWEAGKQFASAAQ